MKFQLIKKSNTCDKRCRDHVRHAMGADRGHNHVNGVLDKLAAELRAVEKRG